MKAITAPPVEREIGHVVVLPPLFDGNVSTAVAGWGIAAGDVLAEVERSHILNRIGPDFGKWAYTPPRRWWQVDEVLAVNNYASWLALKSVVPFGLDPGDVVLVVSETECPEGCRYGVKVEPSDGTWACRCTRPPTVTGDGVIVEVMW